MYTITITGDNTISTFYATSCQRCNMIYDQYCDIYKPDEHIKYGSRPEKEDPISVIEYVADCVGHPSHGMEFGLLVTSEFLIEIKMK